MEPRFNFAEAEPRLRKFWESEKVYAFDRKKGKVYSIDTPPPTVSGDIHLGHVFSYSQAEFIARYKRMRGYNVFYPFGLDNNGLPTELLVEKKYGKTAEQYGREGFIELMKKEVKEYNQQYLELYSRVGLSVDWSLLYETINDNVQRISQKSFIDLYAMQRIYRKKDPVLFCPKCKTVISQMELQDTPLKSKLVYIKFPENITIATSRPELLPACVALFVNPNDERYRSVIHKKIKVPLFGNEVEILADTSIDPNFGTGAEMCCTFGDQNDIALYKTYNLPLRMIIGQEGVIIADKYKGMKIRDARARIIEDLKSGGFVVKEEDLEHTVNTHERCGTEIEFIVKEQWYIRYLDLKDKFIEFGRQVNWYPSIMRVIYENWVNGLKWDWSISRQRFFGVYFPVWYCKKCGEPMLADEKDLPVNPFIDKPKTNCSCGSNEFEPETDVMDTWATSSLTPLINSNWGSKKNYVKKIFPMSMRAQAHDIISFWAFTTIVKSYLHMQSIPWKDIVISGHGLDPNGKSMHKHLGNVTYPQPLFDKYGVDAVRYWASSSILGDDNRFQEKEVVTGAKLVTKLWNLARFLDMKCRDYEDKESDNPIDNFVLNKLKLTIKEATEAFDSYNYFKARTIVENFFWEFANDYIEFAKKRIYDNENGAKRTANKVFYAVIKMLAPFMPYVTEEIYLNLFKQRENVKSIHIAAWPKPKEIRVNKDAAKRGKLINSVILAVRQNKHDRQMALNAPIFELTLNKDLGADVQDIKDAMNISNITIGKGDIKAQGTGIKFSVKK